MAADQESRTSSVDPSENKEIDILVLVSAKIDIQYTLLQVLRLISDLNKSNNVCYPSNKIDLKFKPSEFLAEGRSRNGFDQGAGCSHRVCSYQASTSFDFPYCMTIIILQSKQQQLQILE